MTPPDTDAVAALLIERFDLPGDHRVRCRVIEESATPGLTVTIDRPGGQHRPADRFDISAVHVTGGKPQERWDLTVNAVDALVGTLVESGYSHRAVPEGDALEVQGSTFRVEVHYRRPGLDAAADRLLATSEPGEG